MKKIKIKSVVTLMVVLLLLVTGCKSKEKALPKLVDFGSKTCIPCQKMAPILEELKNTYANELEVKFIDVRLSENQQQTNDAGIKSIPTQIYYDANGKEIWRHVGFISKEDMLNKWKELGYDFKPKNQAIVLDDCADCSDIDEQSEGCSCK